MNALDYSELLHKLAEQARASIAATPADGCPACEYRRRHTAEEWAAYHPQAGTGRSREHGTGAQ